MFTSGFDTIDQKEFKEEAQRSEIQEKTNAKQKEQEIEVAFLNFVNESKTTAELVHSAVCFFCEHFGLEAVGVRLKVGDDYPYFETSGFTKEFIKMENSLCTRYLVGHPINDNSGNHILKCMCGNVINRRFDTSKPYFTARGSFWTNSTTELLFATTDSDCLASMCIGCNGLGYESVALIALRVDEDTLGLLQLNSTRTGQFSQETATFLERLGGYLAVALSKVRVEELLLEAYENLLIQSEKLEIKSEELHKANEALSESEEKYRNIIETANEGISLINSNGILIYVNKKMADMLGYTTEEIIGKTINEFVEKEDDVYITLNWEKKIFDRNNCYDFKMISKDGSPLWVLINSKPNFDDNGKLLGSLIMLTDITERKQAQIALQESENHFRALAENSPDIITRFDRLHRHIYANPAAADSYNIPLDEIIGKTQGELGRSPKNVKLWEEHLENTFITGKTQTLEYQYNSPKGKKYYFETKIVPEFTDGKVLSVLGISRDITNFRKSEAKLKETLDNLEDLVEERTSELETAFNSLKESEKGLSEAQKMAHMGNWEWEIETDRVFWSEEMYRIYGRNPKDMAPNYMEFLNYIYTKDRGNVRTAIENTIDKKPFSVDFRISLTNGEERLVQMQCEAIFDENNNPIKIRGIVHDITERKRMEEKLRESEEKYRNIVETTNEGILIIDNEAIITYANKKMSNMLGYTLEESIGRPIWDFLIEESKAVVRLNLKNRLLGIEDSYELKLIKKDGSVLWTLINAKPFFDIDDNYLGSLSMLTDITLRKEAEQALANFEIAREKEIHHRIKNNLQIVSSLLDLQANTFKGRIDIKDSEVIDAFNESQGRVISMALIHEELHKGGGMGTINFSDYIEKLADNLLLTYRLGNTDIWLKRDIEGDLFFDMDTAIPLGTIVNELISNSFKHAFLGKDKGEIRIILYREDGDSINYEAEDDLKGPKKTNLILSVSDNGVGIPKNLDIENLDSLGLQLVSSLVDQLKGDLEIKSKNGTEFIIRLTVTEKNDTRSISITNKYSKSYKFLH